MSQSKEEKNKALVLEAFETLFNRRDYVTAEQYWSSNYIQHSAHIAHPWTAWGFFPAQ
jgi:predicted SnoaL-like aldol condensation-catalyzing enzyme